MAAIVNFSVMRTDLPYPVEVDGNRVPHIDIFDPGPLHTPLDIVWVPCLLCSTIRAVFFYPRDIIAGRLDLRHCLISFNHFI